MFNSPGPMCRLELPEDWIDAGTSVCTRTPAPRDRAEGPFVPRTRAPLLTATERQLLDALAAAGVSDPTEQAMFLAQMAHETQGFRKLRENLGYSASRLLEIFPARFKNLDDARAAVEEGADAIAERIYGNRADLGNVAQGDGARYIGRGYVHLTGRSNYEAAGSALGLDLVSNPALAQMPATAARIAVWFWKRNRTLGERARRRRSGRDANHQRRVERPCRSAQALRALQAAARRFKWAWVDAQLMMVCSHVDLPCRLMSSRAVPPVTRGIVAGGTGSPVTVRPQMCSAAPADTRLFPPAARSEPKCSHGSLVLLLPWRPSVRRLPCYGVGHGLTARRAAPFARPAAARPLSTRRQADGLGARGERWHHRAGGAMNPLVSRAGQENRDHSIGSAPCVQRKSQVVAQRRRHTPIELHDHSGVAGMSGEGTSRGTSWRA
jgi:putative chitinase